jgi:hypothetical protein
MTNPTHEQITQRAHLLWIERGSKHGTHEQDWLDAEKELTKENNEASVVNKTEQPIVAPLVPPGPPPVPGRKDVLN